MRQTLYELKSHSFTAADHERLLSTIRRDFYAVDCNIVQESEDLYFCNSRSFAGYIPISRHCTAGIRTVTRRTLQEVRHNSSDTFLIWMPIRGAVTITQNGRTATIEPGSFALCYSNEPFCVGTLPGAEHDHLSFQITAPAHLVSRAIPEPKRLCAVPFSTSRAGARIARDLLLSLYEEAEHLDRGSAEALALSALNALFRTIDQEGSELGRSMGVREVKLQRLMDYLELNYSDSELTTETVAKACGISPRYLHYLLKSKGIRFCDYLWQARLNNAYKQLTDTALWRRSISEIAYAIGFKSSAHFSRAFRNQFGQAPREVRQQALADRDIVPRPEIRAPALWLHDDQADKLSPALIASPDLMWPALIN